MLIDVYNKFLSQLEIRKRDNKYDSFAPKAIVLINRFREQQGKDLEWGNPFLKAIGQLNHIDQNEVASYVLLKQFIEQATPYFNIGFNEAFVHLLRYKDNVLIPAINNFKGSNKILDKVNLENAFSELFVLLEEVTLARLEIMKQSVKNKADGLVQKYHDRSKLSLNLIAKSFEKIEPLSAEDQALIPIMSFIFKVSTLLKGNAPTLKADDILTLKSEAQTAKKALLEMPEVKKVEQYIELINVICNFINTHIAEIFESRKTKNINQFFGVWEETVHKAEDVIESSNLNMD